MIKKVFLSICMLFTLISFAQEGTASPFSFFGFGDVSFRGSVENRSFESYITNSIKRVRRRCSFLSKGY